MICESKIRKFVPVNLSSYKFAHEQFKYAKQSKKRAKYILTLNDCGNDDFTMEMDGQM